MPPEVLFADGRYMDSCYVSAASDIFAVGMHQLFLRKDPWATWVKGMPDEWSDTEFQALFLHRFAEWTLTAMQESHMVISERVKRHELFTPYASRILARPLRTCRCPQLPIVVRKCLSWQISRRPRAADFRAAPQGGAASSTAASSTAAPSNAAPAVAPAPA